MPNRIASAALVLLAAIASPGAAAEFRHPDGSDLSNAISAQFVRPMLTIPAGSDVSKLFAWQPLDVDGDAYDELFIKLTKPDLCTDGDCPIVGFMRVPDGSWTPILTAVGHDISMEKDSFFVAKSNASQEYRYDRDVRALAPVE